MLTQILRNTSSPAFKQALNKPSSSRLPTPRSFSSPLSSRNTNSSSRRHSATLLKENIAPKKQGSARSAPAKVADVHKSKKGAHLEDVENARSIPKDKVEDSFTRPVLADLSSMIVETTDSMHIDFDYCVIDYDDESGLEAATSSTPRNQSKNQAYRLATPAGSDAFDLSDYIRKFCIESPLAMRHNDSVEVTRKRSLASLSRGPRDEASISIASIPDSIVYDLDVDKYETDQIQVDDDTLDLSDILEGMPQERLMDTPLSDLMNVEIDHSLEFPTGALNWAPHISVAKFKRGWKRAAGGNSNVASPTVTSSSVSRVKGVNKNRYVHKDERIIDTPLHSSPLVPLEWNVLAPKKYGLCAIPSVPSIIVTSPSDDDLATLALGVDAATVDFDFHDIANGSYKDYLLDASLHNWNMRFNFSVMDPDVVFTAEDEAEVPEVLVTSPSDGNLASGISGTVEFDRQDIVDGSYKSHLLDASLHNWNMRFNWAEIFPDYKDAKIKEEASEVPQFLVTSPSDGDFCLETKPAEIAFDIMDIIDLSYKNYPLDASLHNWNMRFNLDLSGPLDEVY
ncbi:hypothetical protein AX15_000551 [Amanita polypyramis BW_CC]|nr:hypothetical protein AX15_000551 [Amanita polypyramis BW_CC]